MVRVLEPAGALFDPIGRLAPILQSGRWVWSVVLLACAVSLSGASVASRWDATPSIIRELQISGGLQNSTEQELAQKITTAERVRLVGAVAQGVFIAPLAVLLLAALLKLAGWLFQTPVAFAKCFSTAALALLPVAAFHFILGAAALRQPGLVDAQIASLVPSHLGAAIQTSSPLAEKLLSAVDFFRLWTASLLGMGFAEVSGMRRSRGLLVGFALYAIYVAVFLIGMPGMMGGSR
jgi:hypothetical protein